MNIVHDNMKKLIKQSFGFNLKTMRIFGLYPPKTHRRLYKLLTYLMYFCFIVSVPILGCLNLLLERNLDFMQIADNVFLIAELGCFIPKLWPFVNNADKIRRCINYFASPYFSVTRDEHKKILEGCIQMCRKTTAIFLSSVTAGFISWSCRPIVWKDHIFPTDIWLPFDPKSAPKAHICYVYTFLVVAVGYGAFTSGVIDPLVGGLAYQATCQVKILKDNLQHLSEYVDDEINNQNSADEKSQIVYEKIKKCVDHHDAILDYVKEYEDCFSQVAFSQFTGGVLVICVSCLQLTIVDPLSFNFLAMVMYLIAMLSEIYVYCHYGTALYEESNTLTDAIYLGQWYDYDMKSRKALITLMEHSKRPMVVTTGKILDLSLITFMMILRRSYSLLAVLKNY